MTTINISVHCPHCASEKIVKNGHKSNGQQNYRCKNCKKQFQATYTYNGADPQVQCSIVRLLCRNMGIRDIAEYHQISQRCVLNTLKKHGKQTIVPQKTHYYAVQIDELWSFVGAKKNKHWLLYAYAPETKEVLAYVCGSRGIPVEYQWNTNGQETL
jgi:insertion element IS1 protein InsB